MDEYDEDALRADAMDSWQVWSGKLQGMKEDVQELQAIGSEFSSIPGSHEVAANFVKARDALAAYLHTGEEVFEGIARALLATAIDYMEAENYAAEEVAKVEAEMAAL